VIDSGVPAWVSCTAPVRIALAMSTRPTDRKEEREEARGMSWTESRNAGGHKGENSFYDLCGLGELFGSSMWADRNR
jgi:hypothetical protein